MNWWRLSLLYILYLQMPNELIKTFLIIQFYTDCHIPIWVRGGVFNNLPTTNQPYDPKMALPHNLTYVINLEANRVKSPPWAARRYTLYIFTILILLQIHPLSSSNSKQLYKLISENANEKYLLDSMKTHFVPKIQHYSAFM